MRRIERTSVLLHDFKRENRSGRQRNLSNLLADTVSLLVEEKPIPQPIPQENRDHALAGQTPALSDCALVRTRFGIVCPHHFPVSRSLHSHPWGNKIKVPLPMILESHPSNGT